MLAYAAVSFPEQTANSVYTVLEFVKEHPTAASVGIIITAGALLGPDLLAGTAVAGGPACLILSTGLFCRLPLAFNWEAASPHCGTTRALQWVLPLSRICTLELRMVDSTCGASTGHPNLAKL
jgi:hypothetical protein